ncbi:MAG: cob(I)yrinic acid a,c-diamide adenosyltransferase, partial [Clostridia bacterium]|nr:cob(I)yrinic acid a,c-diamide adenosyltransferase [Clostridia bacterium]
MVHIYYGDGKGKTTAAVGLAVRASGNGKRVLFTQFLKSDVSGERRVLECIPTIKMPKLPEKVRFVFDLSPEEHIKYKKNIIRLFEYVLNNLPKYDVVIADEIFSAVDVGFITVPDIIHLMSECPETTELVMTG